MTIKCFSPKFKQKIDQYFELKKNSMVGPLTFSSPLILAPLAQITDAPLRLLMQNLGSGGAISEMISANGLVYNSKKTKRMLFIDDREKNVGLQIFGENAEHLSQAAQYIQEETRSSFIDINMGCPVRKVVSKGGGSALLRDLLKLEKFLTTILKNLKIPLSIKIRLGWSENEDHTRDILSMAHDLGVAFVTIHGRSYQQQFKGEVNWTYMQDLALNSKISIIGNGDLNSPSIIHHHLFPSNPFQALMLGRGILKNPFLFLQGLDGGKLHTFTFEDYLEVIERYCSYLLEMVDNERVQLIKFKKMVIWFVGGFRDAKVLRNRILEVNNLTDGLDILRSSAGS